VAAFIRSIPFYSNGLFEHVLCTRVLQGPWVPYTCERGPRTSREKQRKPPECAEESKRERNG